MKSPDKISRRHKPPKKTFLLKKLKTRKQQDYQTVYFPRNIFGIQVLFVGGKLYIQAMSKLYRLETDPLSSAGLQINVRVRFLHKYFFSPNALVSLGRTHRHLGGRMLQNQAGPLNPAGNALWDVPALSSQLYTKFNTKFLCPSQVTQLQKIQPEYDSGVQFITKKGLVLIGIVQKTLNLLEDWKPHFIISFKRQHSKQIQISHTHTHRKLSTNSIIKTQSKRHLDLMITDGQAILLEHLLLPPVCPWKISFM